MISYIVGRNLGHLSRCMAVVDKMEDSTRNKVQIYTFDTSRPWLLSNWRTQGIRMNTFTRSLLENNKRTILYNSSFIIHDFREEVRHLKQEQGCNSPVIAGLYHSELMVSPQDDPDTIKFKSQVKVIADQTTNIFFHMNLSQPQYTPKFATQYIPIPIVVRKPELSTRRVKHLLGIPLDEPFILVHMGGGTGRYKYKYMDYWYHIVNQLKTDYRIVVASQLQATDFPFKSHIHMAPLFHNGIDLVQAAEMVISKPGRGIIHDCIAMRKPLCLLPADTKERSTQNLMVKQLIDPRLCIADTAMTSAELSRRIYEVIANKKIYEHSFSGIPTNGADIMAQSISILNGTTVAQLPGKIPSIRRLTPFHAV